MRYGLVERRLPLFLRRWMLHFDAAIDDAVREYAARVPENARVLDAGAGEAQHAQYFSSHRYCAVDLAVGDRQWNYGSLDVIADLACLPFAANCFQACINIVTLEHLREPRCALAEIARTLAPGGSLLLIAPHEWEVHQAPHDFYRYTRHGLAYLLEEAGFTEAEIYPMGGYFRLLARRLLNGLQFFSGGLRWIWFLPAALLLVPPALLLPSLDFLDRDRNFTLGYTCTAKKPG